MIKKFCFHLKKKLFGEMNCKGVSLIEMLVTLFIFSVMVGGFYGILGVGDNSWRMNSVRIELQQDLRKAMVRMSDDLYGSGSGAITNVSADGSANTSIVFKKATGVSGGATVWSSDYITYQLGGAGSDELQRLVGTDTVTIAQNISSLSITRQSATPNIVEIDLQAQKNTVKGASVTESLGFDIQLRN